MAACRSETAAPGTSARDSVSVVIGAAKAPRQLQRVLTEVAELVAEVIHVDGGSGAPLRTGLAAARGEYVVIVDADARPDAAAIRRFVGALKAGAAPTGGG